MCLMLVTTLEFTAATVESAALVVAGGRDCLLWVRDIKVMREFPWKMRFQDCTRIHRNNGRLARGPPAEQAFRPTAHWLA